MTGETPGADETFLNVNLNVSTDLPGDLATLDRVFAAILRIHPELHQRSTGPSGEFVMETGRSSGSRKWLSIEPRRLSCGQITPGLGQIVHHANETLMEHAVQLLSIRESDCEALDVLYGFDFRYAGNHDELLVRALGIGRSLESLIGIPGSRVIDFQPSMTLAMDPECLVQCRLSVETRTDATHVTTGVFPDESLSVYFAVREHLVGNRSESLVETLRRLQTLGQTLVAERILPKLIDPIAQAIASA